MSDPSSFGAFYMPGPFGQAARAAVALEETRAIGRMLGLAEAETEEVIETMQTWARERPVTLTLERIREQVVRRASGLEWHPEVWRGPLMEDCTEEHRADFGRAMRALQTAGGLSESEIQEFATGILKLAEGSDDGG